MSNISFTDQKTHCLKMCYCDLSSAQTQNSHVFTDVHDEHIENIMNVRYRDQNSSQKK